MDAMVVRLECTAWTFACVVAHVMRISRKVVLPLAKNGCPVLFHIVCHVERISQVQAEAIYSIIMTQIEHLAISAVRQLLKARLLSAL